MYGRALAAMGSVLLTIVLVLQPVHAGSNTHSDRSTGSWPPASPVGDPVLHWNAIALQAIAEDHSGTCGPPQQGKRDRGRKGILQQPAKGICNRGAHGCISVRDH